MSFYSWLPFVTPIDWERQPEKALGSARLSNHRPESIACRLQNLLQNLPDVLVVLLRGDAEGVDDVENEGGVLAIEIVINRLLGFGRAGFTQIAVRVQNLVHRQADINHRLIADGALLLLELDLHRAMRCGFGELWQSL